MLVTVDRPILKTNFLRRHQFDMSLPPHLLVSVDVNVSLPLMSLSLPSTLLFKISSEYQELLVEFPEIGRLFSARFLKGAAGLFLPLTNTL